MTSTPNQGGQATVEFVLTLPLVILALLLVIQVGLVNLDSEGPDGVDHASSPRTKLLSSAAATVSRLFEMSLPPARA